MDKRPFAWLGSQDRRHNRRGLGGEVRTHMALDDPGKKSVASDDGRTEAG